jgi:signal transduction histidine kinase
MAPGAARRGSLPIDALEVVVDLLSDLDAEHESGSRPFYDRICEAACRLASMDRALLLLYDRARELVVPVGSHGVEPELVALFYGSLDETPVAQRAIAEDRVIDVTELEGAVPQRYTRVSGVSSVTCAPVAAGERALGVIFADRDGTEFALTDDERQAMWMLGKLAAVAASARTVTAQQERSRALAEGIRLGREVHEQVMQRLFGVSMVLGGDRELSGAERARCADELQAALTELRDALARPLAPEAPEGATLQDELARLGDHYKDVPLRVRWERGAELPAQLEPLAASALAEALRNALKHAEPTAIEVEIGSADGVFSLEVRNNGVAAAPERQAGQPPRGSGMGLQLATLEAVQRGGVLEFGLEGRDSWRVRLVLPLGAGH